MSSTEKQLVVSESHVELGEQHVVQLSATRGSATLTVRGPEGRPGLELEIALGPEGPVVRLKTAALQIQTTQDVDVSCRAFRVDASEGIDLRARAVAVEARVGSVVARANDDVQLLGENVLLNCDRTAEIPDWVTAPSTVALRELLQVEESSGDAQLISAVRDIQEPGDASP
jgi:hypothetical protein